jgi:hypothetical protein
MKLSMLYRRRMLLPVLLGILLLISACGMFNPEYQTNNNIRLAVYRYEREQRGSVDELILQFYRTEPRVKFEGQNENGGRTIWLFDLGAKEYFDKLAAEKTYLYIQMPEYNDTRTEATVEVYRGTLAGYQGRNLTLRQTGDGNWEVSQDVATTSKP